MPGRDARTGDTRRRKQMSERFSGYDAKRGTRVSRSAGAPSSVRPSISISRAEYERNRVLSREYYSASQRMDGRESAGQAARRAGASSSRYGSSRYGGASGASSRSAGRAAARPADSARSSSAYRRDGVPSSGTRIPPPGANTSETRRAPTRAPAATVAPPGPGRPGAKRRAAPKSGSPCSFASRWRSILAAWPSRWAWARRAFTRA